MYGVVPAARGGDLNPHLPTPAEFAGMMLNLGGLFEHRGDYGTWKELLIQAKGVAEPEGPDARLLLHLARVYEKLGDNPAAFDCARRGLEAASEDPRVVSPLLGVLGQIEINQGLLREAKRDLTRCLGYSERLNDTEARIQCFVGLGVAATRVGEYDEALRCTNEGIRLARATRMHMLEVGMRLTYFS